MSTKHPRYNFTCDEEMANALKALAEYEDKSISAVAKELIAEALELREDFYLSKLAEAAEKASKGKPTKTHEEVWGKANLE